MRKSDLIKSIDERENRELRRQQGILNDPETRRLTFKNIDESLQRATFFKRFGYISLIMPSFIALHFFEEIKATYEVLEWTVTMEEVTLANGQKKTRLKFS